MTTRRGSDVERERASSLDDALHEARRQVNETFRSGRLGSVSMLREFTPEQRVHARIEISGPGRLRRPEGGLDVMGDGAVVAYRGTIRKLPLEAEDLEAAFERLREELE